MDPAYQILWDADQNGNGIPALRPNESTDDTIGYVIVDERSTVVGSDHRVIQKVVIPPAKLETYSLCEKLLDNYALERAAGEFMSPNEIQEQMDFVDAILLSKPIQVARLILEERLGLTVSNDAMAAMINETWFKLGNAGTQTDASGFEHVFVGEQSSQATKLGGYHYWHKYFLDDGGVNGNDDRIGYHGTQYQEAADPSKGVLIPEIVTLSMTWKAPLGDHNTDGSRNLNNGERQLTKPIGGFFVGCSPECLMAMGLIRCRTMGGKLAKINGAEYQLDLHRLDNEPNSIRTFFPRFRKADIVSISPGGTNDDGQQPPAGTLDPQSPFRIIAAMVNPVNPEGGREFVQILNVANQTQSLLGWKIVAPNGTVFEFSDVSVRPAEVFKFVIPSSSGVLRNRSGEIRLLNSLNTPQHVVGYSTEQAQREGTPVVF